MKTEIFGGGQGNTSQETQVFGGGAGMEQKTAVVNNQQPPMQPVGGFSSRTVFGDEESSGLAHSSGNGGGYRETRKLVGWLVSYSLDPMGVDFKLYEGRNIIGRDSDCNITVNDNMVSSKHAVLLFRANKYSITDSQSSHGTFVDGEDIELEPRYLKDGDTIKIGKTTFKFRVSF